MCKAPFLKPKFDADVCIKLISKESFSDKIRNRWNQPHVLIAFFLERNGISRGDFRKVLQISFLPVIFTDKIHLISMYNCRGCPNWRAKLDAVFTLFMSSATGLSSERLWKHLKSNLIIQKCTMENSIFHDRKGYYWWSPRKSTYSTQGWVNVGQCC